MKTDPKISFHLSSLSIFNFKREPHKMVKHTQKIRRQIADELFECVCRFCNFVGLVLKGLSNGYEDIFQLLLFNLQVKML